MDAKVGDWVVTPRIGKPVEVQALWLNALHVGSRFSERWQERFARGHASFLARFWNDEAGGLFDVVDCDHVSGTVDAAYRPNQIFAVGGLPLALLEGERARRLVDGVAARLWTPLGLRSLAPASPPTSAAMPAACASVTARITRAPCGRGSSARSSKRGCGFVRHARRQAHRRERFLVPLWRHLDDAGLGHVSEIADGDPPYTPRGCPFQAWSVGEALRLDRVVLVLAATRTDVSRRRRSARFAARRFACATRRVAGTASRMRIAVAVVVGVVVMGSVSAGFAAEARRQRAEYCVDGCKPRLRALSGAERARKDNSRCNIEAVKCKNDCPFETIEEPRRPDRAEQSALRRRVVATRTRNVSGARRTRAAAGAPRTTFRLRAGHVPNRRLPTSRSCRRRRQARRRRPDGRAGRRARACEEAKARRAGRRRCRTRAGRRDSSGQRFPSVRSRRRRSSAASPSRRPPRARPRRGPLRRSAASSRRSAAFFRACDKVGANAVSQSMRDVVRRMPHP
jgi:hypothetical protein